MTRLAYTVEEVAALFGRKPVTIQRWLRTGELRGRRVGGVWVIPVEAVHDRTDARPAPVEVVKAPRPVAVKRYVLYRFFDAHGALLYIGITSQGPLRWVQHAGLQPWWLEVATVTVEHFPTQAEVMAAEAVAIVREEPRYNVVGVWA